MFNIGIKEPLDMAITILEDYFICTLIGFGFGLLASWVYTKARMEKNSLGQIIETALIERNVYDLEKLSNSLNQLVMKIKECSEELNERILNARDIELELSSIPTLKKNIEDVEYPVNWEILEKNV